MHSEAQSQGLRALFTFFFYPALFQLSFLFLKQDKDFRILNRWKLKNLSRFLAFKNSFPVCYPVAITIHVKHLAFV